MLTLTKEKSQSTNNIWHSPSSKSNGIYNVEVTHSEHDVGSLSSSPLSSPDSKNMQPESQQNPDATDATFNALSRQSSPLSELSNLNDDDQSQDQQPPEPTHIQQPSLPNSTNSSSISNAPARPVSTSNGNVDESRVTESKSGSAADPSANAEPAGSSTNALTVSSRQQQTRHQSQQPQSQFPLQHTNIHTSKLYSSSTTSHQHYMNGMDVSSPICDYPSSALLPTASSIYPSSSSTQSFSQPNDLTSSKSPQDIPDEKAATIFLLNVELIKVCIEFQTRQLMQTPEFISYVSRLQSNLAWLSAVADQNRQKNISIPIITPPTPLTWYQSHTINSIYQRLPLLFAKEIAKRQSAAVLAANTGQGGGGLPLGTTGGHPSLAAGPRSAASNVPIQPAPLGMMAAGIKRGPPIEPLPDDQSGMRKRVDTGERRHSNPPLASTASPPHVRSPSVMSNATGVGVQDMGMSHQAQIQSNLGMNAGMSLLPGVGMGGMPGMQPVQTPSPHSGSAIGHTSQSSMPMRSSPEVSITQQGQVGFSSLQGAQSHGQHGQHSQNSSNTAAVNPHLNFGVQGLPGVGVGMGPNMSDVQAQTQAAQLAQRARIHQQAQVQAVQANRPNSNAMTSQNASGLMKDPRMANIMPNAGVGASGQGVANNTGMVMNQTQPHLSFNPAASASANQMNSAAAVSNTMNFTAGMSMQVNPPPHLTAQMVQVIKNNFGSTGLSNYQALQTGSSNPFVSYMLTHVPGFAHLPWQQQLQRMQVVQNNLRQQQQQQQRMSLAVDQTNQRNGVMNPAMQAPATPVHNNQGHPQTPIDPTAVGSPFSRQSGSPPNVGSAMQGGMSGSRGGPQSASGQSGAHRHMSPPMGGAAGMGLHGMGLHGRPGTAGSQGGSASGGVMNMKGTGSAPPGSGNTVVGSGAVLNQNMTPQERQLRLMQQQMHQRGKDGVVAVQDSNNLADMVRQQQQHQAGGVGMVSGAGGGQQQQQQHQGVTQGQLGMHLPGAVPSSAGSPRTMTSGPVASFGHASEMGGNMGGVNMGGVTVNANMGMGGMGIGSVGGMANVNAPNRGAPSPSDMLSAAAAARGGIAPNMAQKRPVSVSNAATMQNDMYHQISLYNQAQQRHQQQQMAAGFRPGTAMGGMNPQAAMAAAQAQQLLQQQYSNMGAGTINPGMIYGGGSGVGGVGTALGRVQQSHSSQQQAYLSQAQSNPGQMSQSQPPYHAISPAALQHHPDTITRMNTPGSVGGGVGGNRMGGEPSRPGSSTSNPASMLAADGLGSDSLESLFNWNGGE